MKSKCSQCILEMNMGTCDREDCCNYVWKDNWEIEFSKRFEPQDILIEDFNDNIKKRDERIKQFIRELLK